MLRPDSSATFDGQGIVDVNRDPADANFRLGPGKMVIYLKTLSVDKKLGGLIYPALLKRQGIKVAPEGT